jgi:hypothetical protein
MFCVTVTDLRNLAFEVGELNRFLSHRIETTGRKWYYGFAKRHSQLRVGQPHARVIPGQQVSERTV